MAKDGQDTSAGRPRCETSNFGIYAVLTLEADMVKHVKTTNLLGSSQGLFHLLPCFELTLHIVDIHAKKRQIYAN